MSIFSGKADVFDPYRLFFILDAVELLLTNTYGLNGLFTFVSGF